MNYVELLAAYDKLEAEHCMVLESVVLDAETIHRLESELAAPKAEHVQEPVASLHTHFDGRKRVQFPDGVYDQDAGWGAHVVPLYAAPQPSDDVAKELVELLRSSRELIEHGDFREGHCMCGSAVESHGISDGHPPTDAGSYYAGQLMERIDTALAKKELSE